MNARVALVLVILLAVLGGGALVYNYRERTERADNVATLGRPLLKDLKVADVAELGVRRISVGSSLARAAWTGFARAAEIIAKDGSFSGFDGTVPYDEINNLFK